ncbi:MAG: DUF3500 domain-containing protein [Rudaea sp.]|uniref:DUF3500 domain-containing protein n=1 Tax=Rudaea sp. TaxID=2136325 RepID=UPI0039E599BD
MAARVLALLLIWLSASVPAAHAAVNPNQAGLTGTWYNPETSGQGFVFDVMPDYVATGQGTFFAAWYTFDTTAGGTDSERWYTLQGSVYQDASSTSLAILQGLGGSFVTKGITSATTVGSATLTFSSCTSGSLVYTFDDGRTGTIPLTRLTANVTCTTDDSTATNSSFGLSGSFYTPATSGQGLLIDVNPNSAQAFFGWFTFAPDASSSLGAAGQRWFTGQGAYTSGASSISVDLYEVTGGVFDASDAVTSNTVGTATLTYTSCSALTLAYDFTGGSASGQSGSIALTRLGAAPPGCSLDSSGSTSSESAVVTAANAFLATLSTSQQSTAQLTYSSANATKWTNLPVSSRNGVELGSLSTTQLAAAYAVVDAAISTTGQTLMEEIREGDQVIHLTNTGMAWGYDLYYLAFIGTPSTTSPWMLQISGHHLAYNITYNGNYVSATPMFDGVEPPNWTDSSGTAHAPLEAQRAVVQTLASAIQADSNVASAAKLSSTFSDVVMGATSNGDTNYPFTYPSGTSGRGVLYSSLSSTEQAEVKAVIEAWVNTQAGDIATSLLADYESDTALASTYVGYGVGESGTADFSSDPSGLTSQHSYLRIDGPRVWIEFVVQQGVAYTSNVHYHTVWRDKTADYGAEF